MNEADDFTNRIEACILQTKGQV